MPRLAGPFAAMLLAALVAPAGAATHARPHARSSASHAAAAAPAVPGHAGAGGRTLDDIHIEGEIPVPQVLFITEREQRRFLEFQHRRYLRTGRQLAGATPLPSHVVVENPPLTSHKENSR